MKLLRKIRVAITPRRWLLKTKLSNGAVVYGRNRAGYGGRGIYIFRDALEPELYNLDSLLDPDGVFVDIGANTGVYTLKAAKHFDNKGIVLALEPFPEVLATLYHSVRVNSFTNIRLRNLCAGAQTGVRTLWMNSKKPNLFSLVHKNEKARGLSVLTVSLDDLYTWENLERLDYLKIDAEGAEQEILSGAVKTIKKCRPIIQVEVSIRYFIIALPHYSIFQALGSPNMVYIPKEHRKIHVPEKIGWNKIH